MKTNVKGTVTSHEDLSEHIANQTNDLDAKKSTNTLDTKHDSPEREPHQINNHIVKRKVKNMIKKAKEMTKMNNGMHIAIVLLDKTCLHTFYSTENFKLKLESTIDGTLKRKFLY